MPQNIGDTTKDMVRSGGRAYTVGSKQKRAASTVSREVDIRWAAGSGMDGIHGNGMFPQGDEGERI